MSASAQPRLAGRTEVFSGIAHVFTTYESRTGAGDAITNLRFVRALDLDIGAIDLERGGHLPDVTVAYETWGTLNAAADNAVLVEHALTGDSHVVGEAGPGHPTAGWWQGLIGTGAPLDTDRHFVVATNVLGRCRGTTSSSNRPSANRSTLSAPTSPSSCR